MSIMSHFCPLLCHSPELPIDSLLLHLVLMSMLLSILLTLIHIICRTSILDLMIFTGLFLIILGIRTLTSSIPINRQKVLIGQKRTLCDINHIIHCPALSDKYAIAEQMRGASYIVASSRVYAMKFLVLLPVSLCKIFAQS